jgi:hypothetical protein
VLERAEQFRAIPEAATSEGLGLLMGGSDVVANGEKWIQCPGRENEQLGNLFLG